METGNRGGGIIQRKVSLGLVSVGVQACSASGLPILCVSLIFVLLTQMNHNMRGETSNKS